MPGKEGIETIRELRRANPAVKILAISGSGLMGGADFLSAARELGADDALYKPLRPAELAQRIDGLLAQERAMGPG
jgi:two-component system, chemotaxis family, chemotaxis protein CheY